MEKGGKGWKRVEKGGKGWKKVEKGGKRLFCVTLIYQVSTSKYVDNVTGPAKILLCLVYIIHTYM